MGKYTPSLDKRCSSYWVLFVILLLTLLSACAAQPTYIYAVDVSKCPSEGYIEFILAIDQTLSGKLVVDQGAVVFVVTDLANKHIVDKVVNAGESHPFSIIAKQSGERYRVWFTYLAGEQNIPRKAIFYCNMIPEAWKVVE